MVAFRWTNLFRLFERYAMILVLVLTGRLNHRPQMLQVTVQYIGTLLAELAG
jgi:hypothetical protein